MENPPLGESIVNIFNFLGTPNQQIQVNDGDMKLILTSCQFQDLLPAFTLQMVPNMSFRVLNGDTMEISWDRSPHIYGGFLKWGYPQ